MPENGFHLPGPGLELADGPLVVVPDRQAAVA
jgi:hypothetical protein